MNRPDMVRTLDPELDHGSTLAHDCLEDAPADLDPTDLDRTNQNSDCDGPRCEELSVGSLLALTALVAIARFVFSANRTAFSVMPDEAATTGMARFLTGGEFNMLATNTYRPALSVLLMPIFALVDDPETLVTVSLAVNALIGGLTVFWLAPVIRRLTGFSGRGLLFITGLLLLSPSSLESSAHLWAEPLVSMCFLAALWAVLRFNDEPTWRIGMIALAWSVFGYSSHGRLLPLVGLTAVVVVGRALYEHRYILAGGMAAFVMSSTLLSSWFQDWIVEHVWQFPGDQNTTDTVVERLRDPLQILDSMIGQVWYQLCASLLLFGFGVVVLIRRSVETTVTRQRRDARVVLGMTAPLVGVSIVFMSDRVRADHVIYGRYSDAIIWPVLAVGAWWLVEGRMAEVRRRRYFIVCAIVALTVSLALLLRQLHYIQLRVGGVEPMIAGIVPATGGPVVRVLLVTTVTLVAFAAIFATVRLAHDRPRIIAAVASLIVLVGGIRLWQADQAWKGSYETAAAVSEIRDLDNGPTPQDVIGVSIMPDEYGPLAPRVQQMAYALAYQWHLPDYKFVLDNGPKDDVGPYVFAVTNDALLTRDGGTILWEDPDRWMALWLEPQG